MKYMKYYVSPLGNLVLAADDEGLTGLWFENQKYFAAGLSETAQEMELQVFGEAFDWLDHYFAGEDPGVFRKLHLQGTEFQREVWMMLLEIPYGQTTTYGALAARVAKRRGLKRMSAQAVGSAVGHNPISIIVPCHRVIGQNGSLTGYAGGLDKKAAMLDLEKRGENKI